MAVGYRICTLLAPSGDEPPQGLSCLPRRQSRDCFCCSGRLASRGCLRDAAIVPVRALGRRARRSCPRCAAPALARLPLSDTGSDAVVGVAARCFQGSAVWLAPAATIRPESPPRAVRAIRANEGWRPGSRDACHDTDSGAGRHPISLSGTGSRRCWRAGPSDRRRGNRQPAPPLREECNRALSRSSSSPAGAPR